MIRVDEVLSSDEEGIDDDYGNESEFESENDFSNGEGETDRTTILGKFPEVLVGGVAEDTEGIDQGLTSTQDGQEPLQGSMNASLHLMSNQGLKIYQMQ